MVGEDKKEILENQHSPSTPFVRHFFQPRPLLQKWGAGLENSLLRSPVAILANWLEECLACCVWICGHRYSRRYEFLNRDFPDMELD